MNNNPDTLIANILKFDSKQNSYKIALLRAINDVVLAYPDMLDTGQDVAVPLRIIANYWIAYYWSSMDSLLPIYQGARARHADKLSNDVSFRPQLSQLRLVWEAIIQSPSRPADGYFLINELRLARKQALYIRKTPELIHAYTQAIKQIMIALEQPIRYSGTSIEGEYGVFRKTGKYQELGNVSAIPTTQMNERCILVPSWMWEALQQRSLYVEALYFHEWAIFVEQNGQNEKSITRGLVFDLLTDRPDNRVPLDWERNRILILMQEGFVFTCPWTHQVIRESDNYELDHLIPVSIYPMNELWNLAPTHWAANNRKRDKIPSPTLLQAAITPLAQTYRNYRQDNLLNLALGEDTALRFANLAVNTADFEDALAQNTIQFMEHIAELRNLARVEGF